METQTVEITELKRESGVPIYTTNICPISYDAAPLKPIVRAAVAGVREGFMLHNVLSPYECKQFIDVTEKMGNVFITLGF